VYGAVTFDVAPAVCCGARHGYVVVLQRFLPRVAMTLFFRQLVQLLLAMIRFCFYQQRAIMFNMASNAAVTFVSYQQYAVELSMARLWLCNVLPRVAMTLFIYQPVQLFSGNTLSVQQLAIRFNMASGAVIFCIAPAVCS
jgi:hypothetical protein